MSLLKTGAVQVGQSGTASNNFHWRNLLDGVLRLTRGNAGAPIADVMLVNADNSVAFPSGVSSGVLGAGQTWQNVTGSRALATTYTNNTGKPIQLSVQLSITSAGAGGLKINGTLVAESGQTGTNAQAYCFAHVIPNGATYEVYQVNAPAISIARWWELR